MTGLKPALEAGPFLGAVVVHKDFLLGMVLPPQPLDLVVSLMNEPTCGMDQTIECWKEVQGMKGGGGFLAALLTTVVLAAAVVKFGEDVERFTTDVERERRHPSTANFGRAVGATARVLKDAIGIAEV